MSAYNKVYGTVVVLGLLAGQLYYVWSKKNSDQDRKHHKEEIPIVVEEL